MSKVDRVEFWLVGGGSNSGKTEIITEIAKKADHVTIVFDLLHAVLMYCMLGLSGVMHVVFNPCVLMYCMFVLLCIALCFCFSHCVCVSCIWFLFLRFCFF